MAATHSMLQERIQVAQELLKRVDQLCARQARDVEGRAKLCSKLRAELKFLTKVEAGKVLIKESHLQSTNLTHLKVGLVCVYIVCIFQLNYMLRFLFRVPNGQLVLLYSCPLFYPSDNKDHIGNMLVDNFGLILTGFYCVLLYSHQLAYMYCKSFQ